MSGNRQKLPCVAFPESFPAFCYGGKEKMARLVIEGDIFIYYGKI